MSSIPSPNLSIEDLLKLSQLSRQTLYDEINAKRLKTFKIGRRRFATVDAWHAYQRMLEEGGTK